MSHHNPPQAASAAAHALTSPKHGKHDVVPDEVQAAYASYESSHGKALPAGSRIETKDAVYVVEDEGKQVRKPASPKSSVSQSVQNKFSEIDRQIKSGRKSAPNSPTKVKHQPTKFQQPPQGAGHTGQPAQHVGQVPVGQPVQAQVHETPSRSLAGNVRDHHASSNVHQIGKDRFHEKLVDKHEAKHGASAPVADASASASVPTTAATAAPTTTAPTTGTAPAAASGTAPTTPTLGTTSNPTTPGSRPSPKKRESWGNKFAAFKNRDKEGVPEKVPEKEEKQGGIRGFFSGLTKRSPKTETNPLKEPLNVPVVPVQPPAEKEVPNMSGFRDTQLPEIEQSVGDGRPDEYDTSTFGGKAKAGIASVVDSIGLGSDGAQPEPAHGFAAAHNAAHGGHEFAGERVLSEARAESREVPLGEVPGANAKVGPTGFAAPPSEPPTEIHPFSTHAHQSTTHTGTHGADVSDQIAPGSTVHPSVIAGSSEPKPVLPGSENHGVPYESKLDATGLPLKDGVDTSTGLPAKSLSSTGVPPSNQFGAVVGDAPEPNYKLGNEVVSKLRSGQAGVGIVPDYSKHKDTEPSQGILAQDAKLDDTLPHKSKLDASGLPLKEYANKDVSQLEDSTKISSPSYKADFANDAKLDPTLPHKSNLNAAGLPLSSEAKTAAPSGSFGPSNPVSGDFNLKSGQIAGDKSSVGGQDPRFADFDGPRTLDPGSAVSGDFNLKSNQIVDDKTSVGGQDPRFASSSKPAHELAIEDGSKPRELAIGDGPSTGNPVSGDFNLKSSQIVDDKTSVGGTDPRFAKPAHELAIEDESKPVSGDFNLKSGQIADDKFSVGGQDPRFTSSSSSKPLEITDPGQFVPATGAFNLGKNDIAGDVTKVGNDPRFSGTPADGNPVSGDFNLKAKDIVDDKTSVGGPDPRFTSGSGSTHPELSIQDGPSSGNPVSDDFNLKSNQIVDDKFSVGGQDPRFASSSTIKPDHELAIGDGPSSSGNPVSGDFNLKSSQIAGDKSSVGGTDPRFADKPTHELSISDAGNFQPATGEFNLHKDQIADDVTKISHDPRFVKAETGTIPSGSDDPRFPSTTGVSTGSALPEITDPGHFQPATGAFNLGKNDIADDVTKVGDDPRFNINQHIADGKDKLNAVSGDFNLKGNQIADDVSKIGKDPRF